MKLLVGAYNNECSQAHLQMWMVTASCVMSAHPSVSMECACRQMTVTEMCGQTTFGLN